MYVYGAAVAEVVKAPHLIQQLVAGEHPVGRGRQVVQQLQLFGGRIYPMPINEQFIGVQVDDQFVVRQLLGGGLLLCAGAAQHGMDARQYLLHLEGLDDVVVGAAFQPGHPVLQLTLGGKHDDGRLSALPDLLQHRPAVHHRQHNVQQHQIGLERPEQLHTLAAVPGHLGLEALLLQIEVQQLRNIVIILYDQYLLCHQKTPAFFRYISPPRGSAQAGSFYYLL